MVWVAPGLDDFICPEFGVIGDGVYSRDGDLVCDCGAGVHEVFREIINLSCFLFLFDAEPSCRDPELVAEDVVDLGFGERAVGPAFADLS